MLHAKFQDHRTSGSGEEDFLSYMGMGATWTIYINFLSPFPRRLHMKFGVYWTSGFRKDL